MTEISWLVLLLFLPFCLNTIVSIIDGLLDMKKPIVIVEERVSYKEKVVYRDRVVQKPKQPKQPKQTKQNKPKSPTSPTVSNVIVDEVLIALLSLGIPKSKGRGLISSLVKSSSHKKYLDSETLLQDCIKSL